MLGFLNSSMTSNPYLSVEEKNPVPNTLLTESNINTSQDLNTLLCSLNIMDQLIIQSIIFMITLLIKYLSSLVSQTFLDMTKHIKQVRIMSYIYTA